MNRIDLINQYLRHPLPIDQANMLADKLNLDQDDNWQYATVSDDSGNGYICVYDENGQYLGEL